jgi:hypothetical protein
VSEPTNSLIRTPVVPELLEDLCIELRWVAVFDGALAGEKARVHIRKTQKLHADLIATGLDICQALASLSKETGWRMGDLLADCLRYPEVTPYVRESDGLRRLLRCRRCGSKERPVDAKLFWVCNSCLEELIAALGETRPVAGAFVFRTYTPEMRCSHANDDTMLVAEIDCDQAPGVCEHCLRNELDRRRQNENLHECRNQAAHSVPKLFKDV